jgi:hypothetical protein
MASKTISINRAPVLTLWAAVVARRLGFDEAVSLARAVAGLDAYSRGRRLGLFKPEEEKPKKAREKEPGVKFRVELLGRAVPARNTEAGIRAVQRGKPIDPESVERYLEGKFGDGLKAVRSAMEKLARAYRSKELAGKAYSLYERFRPDIPAGKKGGGRGRPGPGADREAGQGEGVSGLDADTWPATHKRGVYHRQQGGFQGPPPTAAARGSRSTRGRTGRPTGNGGGDGRRGYGGGGGRGSRRREPPRPGRRAGLPVPAASPAVEV